MFTRKYVLHVTLGTLAFSCEYCDIDFYRKGTTWLIPPQGQTILAANYNYRFIIYNKTFLESDWLMEMHVLVNLMQK